MNMAGCWLASSWDFIRGNTSTFSDRQFYRDVIDSSGEPALDVGCGTGRLLLEYLADGLDVDGVDVSPEMLEICAEKAKQICAKNQIQPVIFLNSSILSRYSCFVWRP